MDNYTTNYQKSEELCKIGINQKRIGNYENAIKFYEEAKNVCNTNQNIYYNTTKILIGLGNNELAFKNLITYSHLSLFKLSDKYLSEDLIMRNIWKSIVFKQYFWENQLLEGYLFNVKSKKMWDLLGAPLYIIACDYNSSFLAGLCYLFGDKELLKFHKIDDYLINDMKDGLLGKPANGLLKHSKYENMINLLGLIFILINISNTIQIFDEAPAYYLSNKFIINKDISKFKL